MVNRMRSFIRRPTGNQFCGEEYFNGSGVAGQSLTLGHIPFRELDLVEYHNGTSWVEIFRGTGIGDYALSGSEDLLDRYIWMGSGITVLSSDTGNIHASYRIRSLTVNTEMTINVGEIISNVEASFSDASNISKKALVDTDRHPQNDVLTNNITSVSGTAQTPGDWTDSLNQLTEDTGNISVYTGLISAYTEGISLSLDNIDMYTEGISLSLDKIDMYTEGITISLDNIDTYTGQTASYTEGISLSLDNIDIVTNNVSVVQLPTLTTASGNFKVSIEELPITLMADVNLTSVSGTVQTADDWTNDFRAMTISLGNIDTDLDTLNAQTEGISLSLDNIDAFTGQTASYTEGISLSLDSIDAYTGIISNTRLPTVTTTSGNFKVAILEELPAGTKEIGFVTLAVGDSLVGRVKISDGTTVANVDAGTGAILVKEVAGAVEIANVNITSVSGTVQTAADWSTYFSDIETHTAQLTDAMKSADADEFITRIVRTSDGNEINPATEETLASQLQRIITDGSHSLALPAEGGGGRYGVPIRGHRIGDDTAAYCIRLDDVGRLLASLEVDNIGLGKDATLQDILTAIGSLSEITGFTDHITHDDALVADETYELETELGKKCEYFLMICNKNTLIYLDDDIVGLTNPLKIFANSERRIGRQCSQLMIKITEATNVYIEAFA